MSKSYNLYIDSADRNDYFAAPDLFSTNHNCYFNVDWQQVFHDDKTTNLFEVTFSFNSVGEYSDINFFQVIMNTNSSSYSYEIERKCGTNILGYISTKDYNNTNKIPKVISRPTDNILNIKLMAQYGPLIIAPKITIFKGTINGTTLTIDNTAHPNLLLYVGDGISGLGVAAGSEIVSRLNNYTYTLNFTNTVSTTPLTAISETQPDCEAWVMVINFKPIKN